MNSLVQNLNFHGETFFPFAWTMFWQSSLLIAMVSFLDRVLRRRVSAAIRYTLWLVVLLKLLLPPSLALPTGVAWWVRSSPVKPPARAYTVTYPTGPQTLTDEEIRKMLEGNTPIEEPPATLSTPGMELLAAAVPGVALLIWMLVRWWRIARLVRGAEPAPESLARLLEEIRAGLRLRSNVSLRLTERVFSPAVCGLIRPTILLPRLLVDRLPADQLRAVLLHELVHVRRGDVWVNFLQTLLQIVYWWHPLLWLANGQIRWLREEAVDDAVMLALRGNADAYAPTLLEVAKLALNRPLTGLALVGILESRNALRQRIERLIHFIPPRRVGLSVVSLFGIAAFTALAVPMGEAPAQPEIAPDTAQKSESHLPVAIANGSVPSGFTNLVVPPSLNSSATMSTRNNFAFTSNGRQAIVRKLDQIRLDNVFATNEPLVEVIRKLKQDVRQHDPEKRGINLLINPNPPGPESIDPISGRPAAIPPTGMPDINSVMVTIDPALTNARLAEVLDAIVNRASPPVRYSILDYGIVFSPKDPQSPELHIRAYKFNLADLRRRTGLTGTSTESEYVAAMTNMLSAAGVDLRPPKGLFFAGTNGVTTFRASIEDFKIIERLFESPNRSPATNATLPTLTLAQHDSSSDQQKVEVALLVQDARLLYELGKFDGAKEKLKQALALNPESPAARYYLGLIENRGTSPVLPVPAPARIPGDNSTNVHVRAYKVDRETFLANLRDHTGLAQNSSERDYQQALIKLFTGVGVIWQPANGVFFDQRWGTLNVRAPSADLDFIEAIVTALDYTPPQINIKSKFVQVSGAGARSEVLQLFSENGFPIGNLEKNKNADPGTTGTWLTSVITSSQYRSVLRALEQMDGADLLSDASVTTLSGRQCQIQVLDLKSAVTNINPQALTLPGIFSSNGTNALLQVVPMTGPTLDLVPTVKADGRMIEMKVTPSLAELLGYQRLTILTTVFVDGKTQSVPLPMPYFRFRQITHRRVVSDGQTLVFIFVPDEPGDNAGSWDPENKMLVVLVTPTIIDAAGNRVHDDDPVPAAHDSVVSGIRR